MKYTSQSLPKNAFLKVMVGQRLQKLHFRDVKDYRKIIKR